MRATMMLAAVVVLGQGCVVYAHDNDRGKCDQDDLFDTGVDAGEEPTEPTEPTQPTEPTEPTGPTEPVDFTLKLDPPTGLVGDTLLASLVVTEGTYDLSGIVEVGFGGGDVEVIDLQARAEEVVLVLTVAGDATPGPVDVYAIDGGGDVWLLPDAFTIVEHTDTQMDDTGVWCP